MNGMTLDELLQKKGDLEDIITVAIKDFEFDTELSVSNIQINKISIMGREKPSTIGVVTEVNL
jgi:hypothetical protein